MGLPSQTASQHREAWAPWLHSLARWTHAVTLTCKRQSAWGYPISEPVLINAAKHLVQRINRKCFGKPSQKRPQIAVAATYGWGVYDLHPHLHFCFEQPPHLSYEAFSALIEREADKARWIDRQRCIKPYSDQGWVSYLITHGTDQLIVELLVPAASHRV